MSATPAETFAEKAPLLSRRTLAEVIREDVLAPVVREQTRGIWLHGAFADPDSGIDREDLETPGGPNGLSDIDVFVVLDGWTDEAVTTRFTASEHGLCCRLAAQGELALHSDSDRSDRDPDATDPLDRPAAERLSRPAVPDAIREPGLVPAEALEATVERAERTVFHVREFDVSLLQFRALDLTVGGPVALDRLLGDEPRLRLWPEDDG